MTANLQIDLDELADAIADRMPPPYVFDFTKSDIRPLQVYSAREVAKMLGVNRVASIYEIPETELPKVRRVGSTIGYLGINVLLYMHELPPVDLRSELARYREKLMDERPAVKPLHPEKQRITRIQ